MRIRKGKWVGILLLAMVVSGAAVLAQTAFPDVPSNHPHREAIDWSVRVGAFRGYQDGTFKPDQKITAEQATIVFGRVYPEGVSRAEFAALLYAGRDLLGETSTPTTSAQAVTEGSLGVVIAPEDCAGYQRSHYQSHGASWLVLGGVGYLTGERLSSGDVDHVVALEEAWCSGMRDRSVGNDRANLKASNSSVNRSKGGHDPLEWWNTSGRWTPRTNNYPGWCHYLDVHVKVKVKWGGTMDQAEHDFVSAQLDDCDSVEPVTPPPTTTPTTRASEPDRPSGTCTHNWRGHATYGPSQGTHTHGNGTASHSHPSGKCAGYGR